MRTYKPVKQPTQAEMILAYMKANGGITARQALTEFGCMRLASRIHDLRTAGYLIKTEYVKVRSRHGKAVVARYTLERGMK